tara:strand:- start:331 stop:693 length:363 start_codon:yes stop_codon:yes gene_type:complete
MANNMPGFASDIAADPLGQMPFADRLKRLFPQGQMPPELLQMLMMQLMGSQGGSMTPMGGGRAPQRPPMGGGRPPQRPPMGGSRPPVVKLEDLMAAMTQGPPGTQQANMPVPQARGRIGR